MKPRKSIRELTDKELQNIIANYARLGLETGGAYALAEAKLELLHRQPSPFPVVAVAKAIVEQAKKSGDRLTTYGELWQAFNPGKEWRGNADQQVIGKALGRVIAYCVSHGLPILTTLVVQKGPRKLSDKAIGHIFEEAKSLGVDTGPDPKAFVEQQREAAMALTKFPEDA